MEPPKMRLACLILALLCLQVGLAAAKDNAARKSKRRASENPKNAVEIILNPGVGSNSVIEPDDGKKSYIVVLKDQSTTEASTGEEFSMQNIIEDIKTSCEVSSEIGSMYTDTIAGFSVRATESEVDSLEADNRVKYVYPDSIDYITDTSKNVPTPTGIRRVLANELSCWDNESEVVVAVLDTGVDLDHVELRDGVTLCKSFIDSESTCDDQNGHGTHVAGSAAGANTGVASGAEIWAVKVLGRSGGGLRSGVIAGIDWVVKTAGEAKNRNKKVVINMSLGGSKGADEVESCTADCICGTNAYQEAICQAVKKGIPVVVAAGNSNEEAELFFPAAFPEAITVSAVHDLDGVPGSDVLASFSNYGESVDVAAPGVLINSAYLNGLYKTLSGTSMASPHVAGATLVYMSQHMNQLDDPGTRVKKVKEALLSAADPQNSSRGFTDNYKDSFAEPMLNVKNLENCTPQGKFFKVQIGPKKSQVSYEKGTKKVVMLAKVTDETGKTPKNMKKKNFDVEVQLQSTGEVVAANVSKKKLKQGVLTMVVRTAVLENEGLNEFHDIIVSARKKERSGTGKSAIRIFEEKAIFVSKMKYSHTNDPKYLYIEVWLNQTVSTEVEIVLSANGAKIGRGNGSTNSAGYIRFHLRNPSPGTFTSEFTVSPPNGYAYKPEKNFKDPGYRL